jgi:hypothetical protein
MAGLTVSGGAVKAVGTKDQQIWFTSDAPDPVNGDWWGINLENSAESGFDYVIVEFGEMGIEQFDSAVPVTNSIIRWSNAEGLYAERSRPFFQNNTFYGNGYHDIALEQYNRGVKILTNIFRDSSYAIHHEETISHIEGNYFKNYPREVITAGMESEVVVVGNKFEETPFERVIAADHEISGSGAKLTARENDFGGGTVPIPQFDYQVLENHVLGYIPGDHSDRYPYVYADVDETRGVVKKIGKGQGFGWALTYAQGHLWRFANGFIKINPKSGKVVGRYYYSEQEIMNPRGLDWDGEHFWVNDFSLLRVTRFKPQGERLKVIDSFDIPYKEEGGSNGLATDGEFLYLRARDGVVYKLSKEGKLLEEIDIGGTSLVWTGEYFWTTFGCDKGICKFSKEGELLGEIYPPAKDPWAIAWDGKHLWTIQRTCETWNDPKLYQIEIFDDSLN